MIKQKMKPTLSPWMKYVAILAVWLLACLFWYVIPLPQAKADGLTPVGRGYFHPDHDTVVYVLSGAAAVCLGTYLNLRTRPAPDVVQTAPPTLQKFKYVSLAGDVFAVMMILALVVVIDPEEVAERTFHKDGLHHLSYYVLGPLQGYRHGGALGTEVYTQYGCGWVFVFRILSQFVPINPVTLLMALPIFGAAYFASAYFLLRLLTRSVLWSWVGLLACLQWQLYSGTDAPLWIYPSSTVLRMPCDMLIVAALLCRSAAPRCTAALGGMLGGCSILFGTDTGIYVVVSLVIYSVWSILNAKSRRACMSLTWLWGFLLATAFTGLWIASRNTLWERRFWTGYYEAVLEFGSGFGAMPLADSLGNPVCASLFVLVLMTYSVTVARTCAAVLGGEATDRDLALGTIGIFGFGTLVQFISRSHPYNLFHPIIPACLLITVSLSDHFWRRQIFGGAARLWSHHAKPLSLIVVLMVLLAVNPNVWICPTTASKVAQTIVGLRRAPYPKGLVELNAKARLLNELLSKLTRDGNRAEIIGEDPTLWLMATDRPPMGRYCPAVLINLQQVWRMQAAVEQRKPAILCVVHRPTLYKTEVSYVLGSWRLLLQNEDFSIYASPSYQ